MCDLVHNDFADLFGMADGNQMPRKLKGFRLVDTNTISGLTVIPSHAPTCRSKFTDQGVS